MSNRSRIADALSGIIKMQSCKGTDVFTAEVEAVDRANRACTVTGLSDQAGVTYDGVLLMSCVDDGALYIPKVGSMVLVGNNANQQPFVVMFSELDEVTLIVGNSSVDYTSDLINFNGGKNDGLVNVKPLTEKIKALEQLLNELISNYNSHTHVYTPGGGAPVPTATPIPTETGTITPLIQQSDIEDTKIKH